MNIIHGLLCLEVYEPTSQFLKKEKKFAIIDSIE